MYYIKFQIILNESRVTEPTRDTKPCLGFWSGNSLVVDSSVPSDAKAAVSSFTTSQSSYCFDSVAQASSKEVTDLT